jgi:uncharacterized membrane protein YphA (DoxX/SURF4 family)
LTLLTGHIARILFALPFLLFGISHMIMADRMAPIVEDRMPGNGKIWIYLCGAFLIVASLAIIVRKFDFWAALGLALLLLLYVLVLHAPNAASDPLAMSNTLKDIALAGGALIYAGTTRSGKLK